MIYCKLLKLNILILFILLLSPYPIINAQSNGLQSQNFWLAYMENKDLIFNGRPKFSIYISSDYNGTATISLPSTGFEETFEYKANEIGEFDFPSTVLYAIGSEEVKSFGIKITTSSLASVTAVHYRLFFSEATLLYPYEKLSSKYLVTTPNPEGTDALSSVVIVATENNTIVEFNLTETSIGLRPKDIPFSITLQKGQTYQIQSSGDLSGTTIDSKGKKIAVFGGAKTSNINCQELADNHLFEQMSPLTEAIVMAPLLPFAKQGGSLFKIVATQDNTQIEFSSNDIRLLQAGEHVTEFLDEEKIVKSNKPIHVYQFNPSQDCNSSQIGDPSMLILQSIDSRIYDITFETFSGFELSPQAFSTNYINLLIESNVYEPVILNGQNISDRFEPLELYPEYKIAKIQIPAGTSNIVSDHGIYACVYGFGTYDSYAYSLGYQDKNITSIADSKLNDIRVYPNPFTKLLKIESGLGIENIKLYDLYGHLIIDQTLSNASIYKIDLKSLNSGSYIIQITSGQKVFIETVIKV